MNKKQHTREHILTTAFALASQDGLDSLTIGELAKAAGLSKSGVFAHFHSKDNLQLAVLAFAGQQFVERVIQPARQVEHNSIEAKLRQLLSLWLAWNRSFQGSCMFLDAWKDGAQSDDPIQQGLANLTHRWLMYLHHQIEKAKASGEFSAQLDNWQCVYQLYGVYLSSHLFRSLALETEDHQRFWWGIDDLLQQWRA
ncbi:TetR/AcrR family transcriptional regulator [Photobacterium japonica]|uniref:TetR/AcrR family transcriptional regulator n=1 Tax=Photobacterium japonica TaxID=2910235 RepID=UPI003D11133A